MDDSRFDDLTKTLAVPSRRSLLGLAGAAALAAFLGRDDTDAKKKKKKKKKKGSGCTPKCDGKNCGDDNECGGKCKVQQGCAGDCSTGQCLTSAECPFSQAGADQACCPPGFPNCDPNDTRFSIHRRCESDGVCRCPKTAVDNKPRFFCATTGAPFPDCRDCCDDAHCVLDGQANAQGRTYCWPGSRTCQCPDQTPNLCRVFGSNPLRSECTNINTDPTNCGGCGNPPCNAQIGETCVNGVCRNPGSP